MIVKSGSGDIKVFGYKCTKCDTGFLKSNGEYTEGAIPTYTHICNSCGYTKQLYSKYPIEFIRGSKKK